MATYEIDKTIRFGIEMETVGLGRDKVAAAVRSVTGGTITRDFNHVYDRYLVTMADGRIWTVMRDGSLNNVNGANGGAEIVSPICTYSDMATVQEIARAVRKAGAKVDGSCGIHVHLDGARFAPKQAANLVNLAHKWDNFLTLALDNGRRARWCAPVNPATIQQIRDAWASLDDATLNTIWYGRRNTNPQHYDPSRYQGMNLHNIWYRGTVEFRHFNGTLHAGEIRAYICLALGMGSQALRASRMIKPDRRPVVASKAKYDWRVALIHFGLIGDEFKNVRHHLLARMTGDYNGQRLQAAA